MKKIMLIGFALTLLGCQNQTKTAEPDIQKLELGLNSNLVNDSGNLGLYCINNGSSKDANFIGNGTGRSLTIRFTEANWSNVKNTCGNYIPANQRINGKVFTFPDRNLYQYQMVLFEDGPGVRNYFTNICNEDQNFTVATKKGFKYYVYTNDTSGDHGDNTGYISFCYLFQ